MTLNQRRPSDFGDGVPLCSHFVCPQYDGKRCRETGNQPDAVCVPAVREMAASLAAYRDAMGANDGEGEKS